MICVLLAEVFTLGGESANYVQAWLDFQDFVYKTTDGSPQDCFKKLVEGATLYIYLRDLLTIRYSSIPLQLEVDYNMEIEGLTSQKIR